MGDPDQPLLALERAPTLALLAYQHVKEAIVALQLPPGSDHSEAGLARSLGISRGPLREALRQLAEEGFVVAEERGVKVSSVTKQDVHNMYEVRLALEGQAAASSFGRIPSREIADARGLMARLGTEVQAGNVDRFVDFDIPFHDLWLRHCGNEMLLQYAGRLRDHIRRASNLARGLKTATKAAHGEHLRIIDALEVSRDGFRTAVENHISATAERMLAAFPDTDIDSVAPTDPRQSSLGRADGG